MIPGRWDGSRGWPLVRSDSADPSRVRQRRGAPVPLHHLNKRWPLARATEPDRNQATRGRLPHAGRRVPRAGPPPSAVALPAPRRSTRLKKKEHRHARGPVQIKNPPRHAQTRRRRIQPPSPSPPPTQSRRSPPRTGVRTQPNPRCRILVSALPAPRRGLPTASPSCSHPPRSLAKPLPELQVVWCLARFTTP